MNSIVFIPTTKMFKYWQEVNCWPYFYLYAMSVWVLNSDFGWWIWLEYLCSNNGLYQITAAPSLTLPPPPSHWLKPILIVQFVMLSFLSP